MVFFYTVTPTNTSVLTALDIPRCKHVSTFWEFIWRLALCSACFLCFARASTIAKSKVAKSEKKPKWNMTTERLNPPLPVDKVMASIRILSALMKRSASVLISDKQTPPVTISIYCAKSNHVRATPCRGVCLSNNNRASIPATEAGRVTETYVN